MRSPWPALALLAACSPGVPTSPTQPPRPEPPGLALPGACVDPRADARARFGADAADGELRVERAVDLDDDGRLDPFVAHPSFCGTGGCVWQLYVERGACAHWVGSLFGIWPLPRTARSHALFELEIAARNGCAGAARTESRASFDGMRYVVTSARECHCPDPAKAPASDDDTPEPDGVCDAWAPVESASSP
jgi:hypothetical protein